MGATIRCDCGKEYTWSAKRAGKRARCPCGKIICFPPVHPDDQSLIGPEPTYELSPSGSPVYRHEARSKPFELVTGDGAAINQITAHIERHIGPPENVFHELVSDLVHIDVHVVDPTPQRNWYTLVTSGMSERPMTLPEEIAAEGLAHAELLLCLPADWPMSQEACRDESNYWPIRWLKTLARLPHEYDTWLGWGHTVPNGEGAEPFAPDTGLCCMLVLSPMLVEEDFQQLTFDQKVINFYALFPLYREEMDFKLKHGVEKLLKKFEKHEVSELVDPARVNTCKKRFGLF